MLERYNKVSNSFYSVGPIAMQNACLKWLCDWFITSQLQVYKHVYFKTRTRIGWFTTHMSFWGTGTKLSKGTLLPSRGSSAGFHKHLDNLSNILLKRIYQLSTEIYVKEKHVAEGETPTSGGQWKFSSLQEYLTYILIWWFHFLKITEQVIPKVRSNLQLSFSVSYFIIKFIRWH